VLDRLGMSKWDRLLQSGPASLMSRSSLLWHSALVIMAVIPLLKFKFGFG
jgi:hypothetical protein